jgi:hypothetical protein
LNFFCLPTNGTVLSTLPARKVTKELSAHLLGDLLALDG